MERTWNLCTNRQIVGRLHISSYSTIDSSRYAFAVTNNQLVLCIMQTYLRQISWLSLTSVSFLLSFTLAAYQIPPEQIRQELHPRLSTGANVIIKGHGDIAAATKRWQEHGKPNFTAVVEAAVEADIVQTVSAAPRIFHCSSH